MVDAEKILKDLLESVVKDEGYKEPQIEIKPLSTSGANYTSTLHVITVRSYGMKDLELFAKVACIGEQVREVMQGDRIYATERFVYQELKKIYENLQATNNIPENERLKFPKFYACNANRLEETVILENLAVQGYRCYDRTKSVTWEYAAAAIGELAKLHALSYAFSANDPVRFAQVVEERTVVFTGSEEQMADMLVKSEDNALEMIPDQLKGRLKKFLSEHTGLEHFKKYYSAPPGRRSVLVHGDYRASNLMHRRKNGKLDSLIPVDYQTLHAGAPLSDLMYLIFSGTDGEFRKYHFKRAVQHYYDTFANYLTKLGLDPNVLYPRKHFDEDLKQFLPFGLTTAMFLLPVVLIDFENAPTLQGDAKIEDIAVKPNSLFHKRFLEVVKDYMDWGIV